MGGPAPTCQRGYSYAGAERADSAGSPIGCPAGVTKSETHGR